jgi:hypothetical protein
LVGFAGIAIDRLVDVIGIDRPSTIDQSTIDQTVRSIVDWSMMPLIDRWLVDQAVDWSMIDIDQVGVG